MADIRTETKLLTKKELNKKIGSASFWNPQKMTNTCHYLAGIEDIDNRSVDMNLVPIFDIHEQGLQIKFAVLKNPDSVGLSTAEIDSITIEKGEVIGEEGKSVIGRALIGGLLLGPLGAVAGGVSGIGSKVSKVNDLLMFTAKVNDEKAVILFEIKKGQTVSVHKYFNKHYPKLLAIK